MNTQLELFFEELGLSTKEIKVYLTALKLGPQSASILAKHTEMPRSTANFCLTELQKKGLSSKIEKQGRVLHKALDPSKVGHLIEDKERQAKELRQQFADLLPELKNMRGQVNQHSNVQHFQGLRALLHLIDLTCEKDQSVTFISAHGNMHPKLRAYIEAVYIPASKKHKNKNRMILKDSPKARDYLQKAKGVYKEVHLVSEQIPLRMSTVVIGSRVLLVSYDPDNLYGVILDDPFFAKHMESLYALLKVSLKSLAPVHAVSNS